MSSAYHFHAGSPGGECWPSGMALTDVFGCEDLAAGIYLADLLTGPGRVCSLVDWDRTDVDCSGQVDEDEDLTEADQDRLSEMRALVWAERLMGLSATVPGDNYRGRLDVSLHLKSPSGEPAWYGSAGMAGSLWTTDHVQAQARLAAIAYPMSQVTA